MRVHSQLEQYFSIILVFSNKYKPNKNLARQKKIMWFIKSRWQGPMSALIKKWNKKDKNRL